MNWSALVVGTASALVAGLTGVLAYGAVAPSATSAPTVPAAATTAASRGPTAVVRYRPCRDGARLVEAVCVRWVGRDVTDVPRPVPSLDSPPSGPATAPLGPEPSMQPSDAVDGEEGASTDDDDTELAPSGDDGDQDAAEPGDKDDGGDELHGD